MQTKYTNYELCKKCGGDCCKHYAGIYSPKDFKQKITFDFVLSLLNSGKVAIDSYIGDSMDKEIHDYTYFLRARHANEPAICDSYGGVCVNWSKEKGCSLIEEDRPFLCRKLMPKFNAKTGYNCATLKKDKTSKKQCASRWYKYQSIINEVMIAYCE